MVRGVWTAGRRLYRMFHDDRDRIQATGGRKTGSVLRVHEALKQRVVLSLPAASREAQVAFSTAKSAMEHLVDHGIAQEVTGRKRDRVFAYREYLAALNEGA